MKKSILTFLLFIYPFLFMVSQHKHIINAGIDFAFGLYYFDSDINNPVAYRASIGYEYNILDFLRVGLGVKYGEFNQKIGYNGTDAVSPPMNGEYLAHNSFD